MKYILYARKSSEDKSKQILSLESQVSEMKKLAHNLGLEIDQIYTESKSAKLPNNRPVFSEVVKLLENNHEAEGYGILCWKIDRLSRNPIDSGKIQWLLQQGKIKAIQTSDRQYLPSDNVLLLNIEGSMANQYILDLSKNVKRGILTKIEKGLWPNFAPIGYLNDGKGGIVVDSVRAKYIRRIFKLYSSGNYTIKEIADKLFNEGFKSRANNKYHKSKIYKMLNDSFYYGLMNFHGKVYEGKHEPLISKELFDKCQTVMNLKQHPKKNKANFLFRGLMLCEKCGCLLTASQKKGHVYYYCTNGRGGCDEHKSYITEKEAINILAEIFDHLVVSQELVERIHENTKLMLKQNPDGQEYLTAQHHLLNELKKRENRKDELFNIFLDKTISREDFELKQVVLKQEIEQLNNDLAKLKNEQNNLLTENDLELTKKFFLSPRKLKKAFLKVSLEDKRKMLNGTLWNLTVANKKLANINFKEPFLAMANCAKNDDIDNLRRGRDLKLYLEN